MAVQRIDIRKEFTAPVDKLFAFLSVHKNLETIFAPAKIRRVKDGSDVPDGLGSVRRMRILIAPPVLPGMELLDWHRGRELADLAYAHMTARIANEPEVFARLGT